MRLDCRILLQSSRFFSYLYNTMKDDVMPNFHFASGRQLLDFIILESIFKSEQISGIECVFA